jgi:hypothetical protein
MELFKCNQRRCGHVIEADRAPTVCPVCKCLMANGAASEHDWSDYTKADLLDVADDCELVGMKNKNKAGIIWALEEYGAVPG